MTYSDAGVSYYKKDIVKYIDAGKNCSLEEEIYPHLIQTDQLMAYIVDQPFYDMGNLQGLKELERILQ